MPPDDMLIKIQMTRKAISDLYTRDEDGHRLRVTFIEEDDDGFHGVVVQKDLDDKIEVNV